MYYIALSCNVLYCIKFNCIILHECTMCDIALGYNYYIAVAMYYIAVRYNVSYCIKLQRIILH